MSPGDCVKSSSCDQFPLHRLMTGKIKKNPAQKEGDTVYIAIYRCCHPERSRRVSAFPGSPRRVQARGDENQGRMPFPEIPPLRAFALRSE